MNICVVLSLIVMVSSSVQKVHPKVEDKANIEKTDIEVVCRPPETITVTVYQQKTYKSTYKLFDSQWEEIDTESPYDPIPDQLHISNEQLHEKYIQKCHAQK